MIEALDGEIVLARDSLSAVDGEIAWFFRWLERGLGRIYCLSEGDIYCLSEGDMARPVNHSHYQ